MSHVDKVSVKKIRILPKEKHAVETHKKSFVSPVIDSTTWSISARVLAFLISANMFAEPCLFTASSSREMTWVKERGVLNVTSLALRSVIEIEEVDMGLLGRVTRRHEIYT